MSVVGHSLRVRLPPGEGGSLKRPAQSAGGGSTVRERSEGDTMAAPEADRSKALDAALSQIDRAFGKGSVMRLGDDTRPPVEVIPTGSIALDVALGTGEIGRASCRERA